MQRERVDGTPEALPRVEEAPLPRVGETIAVRPDVQDVEHTTRVVAPRDRIRWGPIWAGLLTVLGVFLLLSVLAIGIGAQTVEPGVTRAGTVATTTAWVSAIIGLIAFFIGGWVAGTASAARGTGAGLLNGFLVWALGIALILAMSAFGLGQLFGIVGNLFTQFRALVMLRDIAGNTPPVDPQQIANGIARSAFITFLAMLLPAVAAAVGGWLGAKGNPIGHLPRSENAY